MKRKKVIAIVVILAAFILLYGIHSIFGNYRFGQELYETAYRTSFEVQCLIKSMDDLEKVFAKEDNEHVDGIYYSQFHNAITQDFGYEDMPVLDEARAGYYTRAEELFRQTMKDEDLEYAFTNGEELQKIADFRDQLKVLADGLDEFVERYRQMSELERYFTSWKKERKLLTDQVRIPE